uniref:Transmembrane serine protease 3a n=1 Tax=Nothobranchius furzeri TaxID=105023 RepID=A0A8C6NXQ0_NOTFU
MVVVDGCLYWARILWSHHHFHSSLFLLLCHWSGCISVRLSGNRSVLQVQKRGEWKTVCSEDWNNVLGLSACKQMGYSRSLLWLHSICCLVPIYKIYHLSVLECGSRPLSSTRIVGGNMSKPGQFPWQVSLHLNNEHICGGSIIAPNWIVTAAHCVYDLSQWTVFVGLTELPINGAKAIAVKTVISHGQHQNNRIPDYDIALMKLATSLVFTNNDFVKPICLPNHGEEFADGTMCWISGWGATEFEGESSVVLRSAMVPLISAKTCNQPDVYRGRLTSRMICAGYLEGGVDACQGDSGGPLACERSSEWKLVGVTSWGEGCALRNKPGVYTNVPAVLSWIHLQMEDGLAGYCWTFVCRKSLK